MDSRAKYTLFLLLILPFLTVMTQKSAIADVVKPALVEISADTRGKAVIELRVSLEALMTGINARYKNTQDAPNAAEYDALRVLQKDALGLEFDEFRSTLLERIWLKADGTPLPLTITAVEIPEPGYTKVPRISVLTITAPLARSTETLQWYYPGKFGDNAVRVRQVNEEAEQWHWSEWQWLRSDKPSEPFTLSEVFNRRPVHQVVGEYVVLGFKHILPYGLDHILFIIGIFLLSTKLKPLLWQVTMFTVAHTISLGLAINGIFDLPANIVEPLIALSIAYIGFENIFAKSLHKSRLLLVFLFGLLHGMGFASVLMEFGMPQDAFLTALISFNVGVELGQLLVIMLGYLTVGFWFSKKPWYHNAITVPGSAIIAVFGLYWTFERIAFS